MNGLSDRAFACALDPPRSWRTVPEIWGCAILLVSLFFLLLMNAIYNDRRDLRLLAALITERKEDEDEAAAAAAEEDGESDGSGSDDGSESDGGSGSDGSGSDSDESYAAFDLSDDRSDLRAVARPRHLRGVLGGLRAKEGEHEKVDAALDAAADLVRCAADAPELHTLAPSLLRALLQRGASADLEDGAGVPPLWLACAAADGDAPAKKAPAAKKAPPAKKAPAAEAAGDDAKPAKKAPAAKKAPVAEAAGDDAKPAKKAPPAKKPAKKAPLADESNI